MLVLLLLACAPDPCDEPHTCPDEEVINCMPVVPEAYVELCDGECREWVEENCEGVSYVE